MPEKLDITQIKEELDMKRAKIKEEFESKIQKFKKNAEQYREKINAYRKKRDADIARIEESLDKKIAATLKKRLGEEDYRRMQQWLLEKKKKESDRLEKEIQPAEDEDYDKQFARMQKTDRRDLLWVYYSDNEDKLREELKREIVSSSRR